jgi:hypothetical protein
MDTPLLRSSRAIFVGAAATLGLAMAPPWPAPAQSRDVPAAGARDPAPSGAQVLLQRRRDEVRELEAAWAARRQEVEQHLADIVSDAKSESRKAEAEYQDGKVQREIAEIAIREYAEGIYVQDLATIEGEIKLAESDLVRLEDRLEMARRAFEKGFLSKAQLVSEELAFRRAQFTLEQRRSRLDVLKKYDKERELKKLSANIDKARAEELSKQAAWELAKRREDTLAARSKQLGSPLTETHIAALLDEAASLQAKVVQLLTRAQESGRIEGLTAERARLNAETVQQAIAQARSHEDAARAKLGEALALARLVQTWREELRDTESRLRKARADLERLEKLMHQP